MVLRHRTIVHVDNSFAAQFWCKLASFIMRSGLRRKQSSVSRNLPSPNIPLAYNIFENFKLTLSKQLSALQY